MGEVDLLEAQLPDILAISSAEVTLPTLNMNSSELNELSLSGIINTIGITPGPAMQVVQVDSNTIQGQNQPITFHLQPMDEQVGPIRDMRDNIQGFPEAQSGTTNSAYQEFQNLLSNKGGPVEQKPYLKILEQPASHKLRFRYKCEGRGAGALQGERSTSEKKTFPKIQIVGYKGPAVVVVSCVTHDSEVPKTHPHNLVSPASVGREGCKKGVCTIYVNNEDMTVEFPHLGIQCVRKKDVDQSLKVRKEIRVDPYRAGFRHSESPASIDLNAVRLCFQAFLESPTHPGKYNVVLPPVSSNTIYDAKAKKELQMMDISDVSSPLEGGKKIIILCEKVTREDIKVRFYDPEAGWEGWGVLGPNDVHKQYAISLITPAYTGPPPATSRRVLVELVKPSEETNSEPSQFWYLNNSTGGLADNTGQGFQVNPLNNFGRVNSVDGGRGQKSLPETVSKIKVEKQSQGKTNSKLSYNMEMFEEPLICYEDNYSAAETIDNLLTVDKAVNNLSGKIETFSLSDAIETSLSMESSLVNCLESEVYNNLVGRRGSIKRCCRTAALESGSDLSPRTKQSSLHTPGNSDQLDSSNLLRFLTNCNKINDL